MNSLFLLSMLLGLAAAHPHSDHVKEQETARSRDENPNVIQGRAAPVTVEITKTRTVDRIITETDTEYNTDYVTFTEHALDTLTSTVEEVIRTPVNSLVKVTTTQVVSPTTVTFTNERSNIVYVTNTETTTHEIEHTRRSFDFVTTTNTVERELSVTATTIRTEIKTVYTTRTDYQYVTHYEYEQAYRLPVTYY